MAYTLVSNLRAKNTCIEGAGLSELSAVWLVSIRVQSQCSFLHSRSMYVVLSQLLR